MLPRGGKERGNVFGNVELCCVKVKRKCSELMLLLETNNKGKVLNAASQNNKSGTCNVILLAGYTYVPAPFSLPFCIPHSPLCSVRFYVTNVYLIYSLATFQ